MDNQHLVSATPSGSLDSGDPLDRAAQLFLRKELALMAACVEFGTLDSVDFNKVAERAGYKDAKNTRIMWRRLKTNKLGIKGNTKSDGDGTNDTTSKTPAKSRANRVTKSKKTKSKVKVESSDEEEQASSLHISDPSFRRHHCLLLVALRNLKRPMIDILTSQTTLVAYLYTGDFITVATAPLELGLELARMYIIADKFQVDRLKQHVVKKFGTIRSLAVDAVQLLMVAERIYTNVSDSDTHFRDAFRRVAPECLSNMNETDRKAIREKVNLSGLFGKDVFDAQVDLALKLKDQLWRK
ncbi:MAG: hypothetical protein M1812_001487 [Candelaria pacifica]|nr:MAG: hypothetical protein M1812_001487 [Candelaria pacifica]